MVKKLASIIANGTHLTFRGASLEVDESGPLKGWKVDLTGVDPATWYGVDRLSPAARSDVYSFELVLVDAEGRNYSGKAFATKRQFPPYNAAQLIGTGPLAGWD